MRLSMLAAACTCAAALVATPSSRPSLGSPAHSSCSRDALMAEPPLRGGEHAASTRRAVVANALCLAAAAAPLAASAEGCLYDAATCRQLQKATDRLKADQDLLQQEESDLFGVIKKLRNLLSSEKKDKAALASKRTELSKTTDESVASKLREEVATLEKKVSEEAVMESTLLSEEKKDAALVNKQREKVREEGGDDGQADEAASEEAGEADAAIN